MQKSFRIVLALLFVFGLLLVRVPDQAQAKKIDDTPNIAGGSWTSGSVMDVTSSVASAPSWLQLLSTDGVKTSVAQKICHPLRGGQFGWVAEIMQYKDGKWIKLPTTSAWVPSTEGEYMACADAPAAGIYALFGYYIAPQVADVSVPFDCSTVTWTSNKSVGLMVNVNEFDHVFVAGTVTGISASAEITYEVTASSDPALFGLKGSVTHSSGIINDFDTDMDGSELTSITVLFHESDHGCTSTTTTSSIIHAG